jgi:hypothetical protein
MKYLPHLFSGNSCQNHFSLILRCLHFTGNETDDKINNMHPVYDNLFTKFREMFFLDNRVTVDESLMLLKGRIGWKQFIRAKWARFGIKTFDLCECSSGYVFSNTVYTGKGMDIMGNIELWLSGSIEMSLLTCYWMRAELYLDNWYSSPRLYIELHNKSTGVCRTVQEKHIGFSKDIDKKALKRGEMDMHQLQPLT